MPLKAGPRPGTSILWITGTVAGRRIRQSAGTADQRLADEKAAALEADLYRRSIYGERVTATWEQACTSYVKVKRPTGPTCAFLDRLTAFFGPGRKLSTIEQSTVDDAVEAICAKGSSPATHLRAVITPLRAVLNHAARRKWCDVPLFETPAGSAGSGRTRWLTPAEFVRLHESAAPHLQPLLTFMVCTGARIGEALGLDWRDVDLAHAKVILRGVKSRHGEVRDRHVDLLPAAVAAMGNLTYPMWHDGRPVIDEQGKRVWGAHREGPVFRTDLGTAYRTFGQEEADWGGQIRTAWATACRGAGFAGAWHTAADGSRWWTPEDVTPHVLRHTWASWDYALSRDLLGLRDRGLWSSVKQVERYAKCCPAALVPAIRAVWCLPAEGTFLAQRPG